MKRAAILIAALGLGACGGPTGQVVWNRAGATEADFRQDRYLCFRDAKALGGTAYQGFGITERNTDWSVYTECMLARGWTPSRA